MKTPDKSTEKTDAVLVGTDTFDLYLKEIGWNLRSMMAQADVLETAVGAVKKQLRDHIAAEQAVAHSAGAQDIDPGPAD